jgi:hypothetical protein
MSDPPARRSMGVALLVGVFYVADGLAFGALAQDAPSHRLVVAWRLMAWLTSGIVFTLHVVHEHARSRHSPVRTAIHASFAAALGSFGLAAAALAHALASQTGKPVLLAIALVAWPILTVVPASLVAFALALVLRRIQNPSATGHAS